MCLLKPSKELVCCSGVFSVKILCCLLMLMLMQAYGVHGRQDGLINGSQSMANA